MKRNIYYFNNLLRTYNKYRRKLVNLRKANKNERRQHILQNHIAKLYEKLMVLKMSVKLTTVAASVVVGTLAFAPQTVQGQITFGAVQTNPFGLVDIGNKSAPDFVDLDGDGDLDVLAANRFGDFRYFENIGTSSSPIYTVPQINPFGINNAGSLWVDLVLVDIDSDGDMDLLYGNYPSQITFLENIGTPTVPSFSSYQINPFGLTNVPTLYATPTFADVDNDGDFDLFSGGQDGKFYYYQNSGTSTVPNFSPVQTNPFGLDNLGFNYSNPFFVDIDGDGDMDLFTGETNSNFKYYENIGTSTTPSFLGSQINPFNLNGLSSYMSNPTFADLDNDGDMELLSGEYYGNFKYFENTSTLTPPCALIDQTITTSQTTLCDSGVGTISTGNSEIGINYFLRNDADSSIVDGPIAGTGAALNLNTGTINATTTYNVYAEEVPLSAINLPNNNDFIRFNIPFNTYTNEITVEAWVNFTGTNHTWAGQSSANADNMSTNVWLWHDGTFFVNNNGNWVALVFPAVTTPGWKHVATVANASGLFIYYDGVLVASNTQGITSGIRNNASSVIELGEDPRFTGNTGRNSNTVFDNFRVWNIARSATEIANNYQSCLTGSETGLVQSTLMNEGTGTALSSLIGSPGVVTNGIANPWVEGSGVCDDACTLEMSQLVTITVNNSTTSSQTFVECAGFSITVGTNTYNATGVYTDVFVGSNGCDSTVTTDLTIKQPTTSSQTFVECQGFSINVGTNTYNTTGVYTDVLVGSNGCDSTVTTDLTIKQPTTISQTLVECAGFSITVGTNTYSTTGVYTDVLTGSNGCDSTVTTDLTIKQPTTNSQTFVECQGFSINVGTNTYNTTGVYTDVLVGSNGCDSTVTTDLTIKQPTTSSQTLVECAGFSITVGTNTYNATGVYTDVLTGSNGCDSTVTTDLTIEQAIDVTVDNSLAPTLSANQTGATYQWLDCDNGNVIIPSETAQSFTATVNGNYAVEITIGSCVDTSACENISTVGVKETANDVVSIYPNPTSGMVNINLGSNNSSVNYSITSIEGKVVETGKTSTNNIMVDLSKEGNGVYFVKINTENTSTVYKLIKQ